LKPIYRKRYPHVHGRQQRKKIVRRVGLGGSAKLERSAH